MGTTASTGRVSPRDAWASVAAARAPARSKARKPPAGEMAAPTPLDTPLPDDPGATAIAGLDIGLQRLAALRPTPPYWCAPQALRHYFRIPELTPSNNQLREMHFYQYKRLREAWFMHIRRLLAGQTASVLEQSALAVVRHSAGGLDWDNALGGLKPLQDCLVQRSARNPNGLGLVVDDSPRHMPYPPFMLQKAASRGQGFVELFIFEVADDAQSQAGRPASRSA